MDCCCSIPTLPKSSSTRFATLGWAARTRKENAVDKLRGLEDGNTGLQSTPEPVAVLVMASRSLRVTISTGVSPQAAENGLVCATRGQRRRECVYALACL